MTSLATAGDGVQVKKMKKWNACMRRASCAACGRILCALGVVKVEYEL